MRLRMKYKRNAGIPFAQNSKGQGTSHYRFLSQTQEAYPIHFLALEMDTQAAQTCTCRSLCSTSRRKWQSSVAWLCLRERVCRQSSKMACQLNLCRTDDSEFVGDYVMISWRLQIKIGVIWMMVIAHNIASWWFAHLRAIQTQVLQCSRRCSHQRDRFQQNLINGRRHAHQIPTWVTHGFTRTHAKNCRSMRTCLCVRKHIIKVNTRRRLKEGVHCVAKYLWWYSGRGNEKTMTIGFENPQHWRIFSCRCFEWFSLKSAHCLFCHPLPIPDAAKKPQNQTMEVRKSQKSDR